jgi:uncharacterized protein DUF6220
METARKAYTGLAYAFTALVVLQVFLAGIGIFGDWHVGDDSNLEPHRILGNILVLVSLVLLLLALVGRMGRIIWAVSLFLAVIVVLQSVWVHVDGRWVKAIHPTMTIVIFALGHYMAEKSRVRLDTT